MALGWWSSTGGSAEADGPAHTAHDDDERAEGNGYTRQAVDPGVPSLQGSQLYYPGAHCRQTPTEPF